MGDRLAEVQQQSGTISLSAYPIAHDSEGIKGVGGHVESWGTLEGRQGWSAASQRRDVRLGLRGVRGRVY